MFIRDNILKIGIKLNKIIIGIKKTIENLMNILNTGNLNNNSNINIIY